MNRLRTLAQQRFALLGAIALLLMLAGGATFTVSRVAASGGDTPGTCVADVADASHDTKDASDNDVETNDSECDDGESAED